MKRHAQRLKRDRMLLKIIESYQPKFDLQYIFVHLGNVSLCGVLCAGAYIVSNGIENYPSTLVAKMSIVFLGIASFVLFTLNYLHLFYVSMKRIKEFKAPSAIFSISILAIWGIVSFYVIFPQTYYLLSAS